MQLPHIGNELKYTKTSVSNQKSVEIKDQSNNTGSHVDDNFHPYKDAQERQGGRGETARSPKWMNHRRLGSRKPFALSMKVPLLTYTIYPEECMENRPPRDFYVRVRNATFDWLGGRSKEDSVVNSLVRGCGRLTMGRRPGSTTKSGRFMNPADQERKSMRQKELKRNRKQRTMVRHAILKSKDVDEILENLSRLDDQEFDIHVEHHSKYVFNEKRIKFKQTYNEVMNLYKQEKREDKVKELEQKMLQYEAERARKIQQYNALRFSLEANPVEIPLPDGNISDRTEPPGPPCGLPPLIGYEDDDDDETPSKRRVRFEEDVSNSTVRDNVEATDDDFGPVEIPMEVLEHSQIANGDTMRSAPMLAPIIPQQPLLRAPPIPPNMLPPPPRLPLRVPPPPPHFRMPIPFIRPPGTSSVISAEPIVRRPGGASAKDNGEATISAEPKLRDLTKEVTKFVPTALRVNRSKHQPKKTINKKLIYLTVLKMHALEQFAFTYIPNSHIVNLRYSESLTHSLSLTHHITCFCQKCSTLQQMVYNTLQTAWFGNYVLMTAKNKADNSEESIKLRSQMNIAAQQLHSTLNPRHGASAQSWRKANEHLLSAVRQVGDAITGAGDSRPPSQNLLVESVPPKRLPAQRYTDATKTPPPVEISPPPRPPPPPETDDEEETRAFWERYPLPGASNQPILSAAHNLHQELRQWSSHENEIVAAAKRMAILMARLSQRQLVRGEGGTKKDLIDCAKAIADSSEEVTRLAVQLARAFHLMLKTLLQVCERIPTIATQLKILSTVKVTMLGSQATIGPYEQPIDGKIEWHAFLSLTISRVT
ncbi:WW domain-binding protein 11 [Dirofilaria immitis]|nr:WW domain-binding protein 11 [Dirofilaria immitis]